MGNITANVYLIELILGYLNDSMIFIGNISFQEISEQSTFPKRRNTYSKYTLTWVAIKKYKLNYGRSTSRNNMKPINMINLILRNNEKPYDII